MTVRIEHFLYGTPARLKRLRAALPAGIEVRPVAGGLILREDLVADPDMDSAVARISALAGTHGVDYDGHGQCLPDAAEAGDEGWRGQLQARTFGDRTGIGAGHGFAVPLPDGRFGHAVCLGSDRKGHLLLDISALVTDRPASPDAVRAAQRRYRQPILFWHTPFPAIPLAPAAPLAQLPCDVMLRCGIGWPQPEDVARLERRTAITQTDTPEGWNALLTALAEAGERLPGIEGYSLWTARVGRTGTLKLIEDHEVLRFADMDRRPMPWQPARMDEITAILAGGPDVISARDKVT
jgi:hypothetical protein